MADQINPEYDSILHEHRASTPVPDCILRAQIARDDIRSGRLSVLHAEQEYHRLWNDHILIISEGGLSVDLTHPNGCPGATYSFPNAPPANVSNAPTSPKNGSRMDQSPINYNTKLSKTLKDGSRLLWTPEASILSRTFILPCPEQTEVSLLITPKEYSPAYEPDLTCHALGSIAIPCDSEGYIPLHLRFGETVCLLGYRLLSTWGDPSPDKTKRLCTMEEKAPTWDAVFELLYDYLLQEITTLIHAIEIRTAMIKATKTGFEPWLKSIFGGDAKNINIYNTPSRHIQA